MSTAEVRAHLDRSLELLERHSIESAKAGWPALRAEAHVATASANGPEDTCEAIRHVIATLGDPHTHLITAQSAASPAR